MTEYTSAVELLDAIERLSADVSRRLAAIAGSMPAARALSDSVRADLQQHARDRRALRRWLRLAEAAAPAASGAAADPTGTARSGNAAADLTLDGLRAAQEALMLAHAEGLPALGDARAVNVLGRHLIDLSRHLTVTELWIHDEERRD